MQERDPDLPGGDRARRTRALAGEIADGWIPTLFSPEHVAEFRPLLEEGAARAGRSLDGFDIAPTVNVFVTDDLAGARDAMRPFIALYVGGMGSRKQNFYNQLVQRYGFEDAAREVQDLYLEGKREEAMAALPGRAHRHGLAVRPARPRARAPRRLPRRRRRDAGRHADGVDRGRSASSSCAWSPSLPRLSVALRLLLGAFGDPGHAFPMIALGRALAARGHDVVLQTWTRWEERRRARGHALRGRRPSTTSSPRASAR